MIEAALEGLGLAFVSDWWVSDHLAKGSLRAVLEDWTPPFPGLCLYYPRHRHMTAGLRAFIDLIREQRKSTAAAKEVAPSATKTTKTKLRAAKQRGAPAALVR
jgi:DNA-binding transcriptional LysR family regulator